MQVRIYNGGFFSADYIAAPSRRRFPCGAHSSSFPSLAGESEVVVRYERWPLRKDSGWFRLLFGLAGGRRNRMSTPHNYQGFPKIVRRALR